jgi:putative acetyltransferase
MSLLIRRPTQADVPGILAGVSRPEVFAGLLQMPYPSETVWRQRVDDMAKGSAGELLLVAEQAEQLVGLAGLHSLGSSPRVAHVRSLGIWVLPEAQGQGVGRQLMDALIDYADNWLGVRRLELTVNVDNAPALALYKRCGFELEGTHKGYALRDGQYVDCFSLARCRF